MDLKHHRGIAILDVVISGGGSDSHNFHIMRLANNMKQLAFRPPQTESRTCA